MATLIMGFSKRRQPKAPELPPRNDQDSVITEEEEVEEIAEQVDEQEASDTVQMIQTDSLRQKASKASISLDTEAIMRQANENLETSQGSVMSMIENKIPLPKPIDKSISLNQEFLETFRQVKNFKLYNVQCDFVGTESRHLSAKQGNIICGFHEVQGWVCGFQDTNPTHFGFVPKNYLQFIRATNSQTITPTYRAAGDKEAQTEAKAKAQVTDYLQNLYSESLDCL